MVHVSLWSPHFTIYNSFRQHLKGVSWMCALVSYGCQTNNQIWGLKQQKLILSPFWRPAVRDQDVDRASRPLHQHTHPPPVPQGRIYSLPLPASGGCRHSSACGCISLLHLHTAFSSVGVSSFVCLESPSVSLPKDICHWIQGTAG